MNRWELELNQVEDALVHTWKLEFNYNGAEILNWIFQMTVTAGNSQQIKSEIHIFLRKKQLHIMIFVEDGNGPKQIFMILLHIMSMIKQQKYTCDWTWTRIVNEWMYSLRLLHCVNIWCSRESDEKRPISNFPKLSESKLFCLRARLSTNNQSLRLWFRVSTEELYSRISDCHLKQKLLLQFFRRLASSIIGELSTLCNWKHRHF